MPAEIIDGRQIADEIRSRVSDEAHELGRQGRTPFLVAVQVGEDPAALMYAGMQERSCNAVGVRYELQTLPRDSSQEQLLAHLAMLNASAEVTGLLLQMPLPDHIDPRLAQRAISQDKDVEGIHPHQLGRLFYGELAVAPCTAMAAHEMIRRFCPDIAGKEAVLVGHSEIIGKPLAMMLLASRREAPTVTVCHVATRDVPAHLRRAEILVVAVGQSQKRWQIWRERHRDDASGPPPDLSPFITADMIRPGAVVIDVAINRIPVGFDESGQPQRNEKGKLAMRTVGDVDFEAAREVAAAITPVPGGIGPLTVAMLLQNVITCARRTLPV